MESSFKCVSLYLLLAVLIRSSCVEASGANCTNELKQESLKMCADAHLKQLKAEHFFDGEVDAESEIFYKDPYRFVDNPDLCDDIEEAANYVKCSIKVFADCVEANSSDAAAHTSVEKAGQAVTSFCEGLNVVVEKSNNTSELKECVMEKKPDTYKCVYNKIMNEDESTEDACAQYKVYSDCMGELDACGEEYDADLDLFSTWAKQMTPSKCLGADAASSVIATAWMIVATLMLSLWARW